MSIQVCIAAPLLVAGHCCTAGCPQDRTAPDNVDAIVEDIDGSDTIV